MLKVLLLAWGVGVQVDVNGQSVEEQFQRDLFTWTQSSSEEREEEDTFKKDCDKYEDDWFKEGE